MIRTALIVTTALLAACFESHKGVQELRGDDCYTCHVDDYDATSMPVHTAPTVDFPTACVNCHKTTDWQPALEGNHPAEIVFPIQSGAHATTPCLQCHDLDVGLPSSAGANTNCIGCHPNDAYQRDAHVGTTSVAGTPYQYRADIANFCLVCHPKGTALKHPDDKFPRTGDHNASCVTCHDRSAGNDAQGANTTCLVSGCHSLGEEDGQHREVNNYTATRNGPWPQPNLTSRNFCRVCHPRGRN